MNRWEPLLLKGLKEAALDPATNPNGPYSTPQPTVPEMVDFCQTFHRLDGEIVDGKINDGTPYRFPCVCKPS